MSTVTTNWTRPRERDEGIAVTPISLGTAVLGTVPGCALVPEFELAVFPPTPLERYDSQVHLGVVTFGDVGRMHG